MKWKVGDRIKMRKESTLFVWYREKRKDSAFYQDAYQKIPLEVGDILVVAQESTRWHKVQADLPSFWVEGMNRPTYEWREEKVNKYDSRPDAPTRPVRVKIDDHSAFWPDGSVKKNYQRADGRLNNTVSLGRHMSCIKLDESYFERLPPLPRCSICGEEGVNSRTHKEEPIEVHGLRYAERLTYHWD